MCVLLLLRFWFAGLSCRASLCLLFITFFGYAWFVFLVLGVLFCFFGLWWVRFGLGEFFFSLFWFVSCFFAGFVFCVRWLFGIFWCVSLSGIVIVLFCCLLIALLPVVCFVRVLYWIYRFFLVCACLMDLFVWRNPSFFFILFGGTVYVGRFMLVAVRF